MRRIPLAIAAIVLFAPLPLRAADELMFEKHVRPILKAHCFHCHGEGDELAGGLDLRLKRLIAAGGDSGAAITPGKSAESYLVDRLRSAEMPPAEAGKPLAAKQIDVIARWIDAGAPTARPEPEQIGTGMLITQEDREYWAYQPIRRPAIPTVEHSEQVRNAIDAFILRRLEEHDLQLSPEADRRTLIRRLSFDLLGLPPTPEEVAVFVADDASDAYERLVDRLLASPQYGERWGRHWLDVAGYADSEGMTNDDHERKWAWKYRDYVIDAFNADLPFDRFVREQLAGDELVNAPHQNLTSEQIAKLTATGFLRMAPDGTATNEIEAGVARNQVVADTVDIVSSALLGMTVKCAQCHEHRYDPIPQADYYRFRAIFEPALDWKSWKTPPQRLISLETDEDRRIGAELEEEAKAVEAERTKKQQEFIAAVFERELAKVPAEQQAEIRAARDTPEKKRTAEQTKLLQKYPSVNVSAGSLYLYDRKAADALKKLAESAKEIRDKKPQKQFLRALAEPPGHLPQTFLFTRGDHEQPAEEVEPAGLTILGDDTAPTPLLKDNPARPTTGRRLAYAEHLTSGDHPLFGRVIVNRLWMHHFGQGIVATPSDFGRLGAPPTHPELLDWLADEFRNSGWSVKHMHRLMLTSATYRQQLRADRQLQEADPDNRLLATANIQRLDAETLRDSILAVSGRLNAKPFGPPVPVMADLVGRWVIGKENLNAGRPGAVIPMQGEEFRRSVYIQVRRSRPLAVLDTFDWPRMEPNCSGRTASTVAPQSLMLMNGTFTLEQAEAFAERVILQAGADRQQQVIRAWQLAYAREPSSAELSDAQAFLEAQSQDLQSRVEKGQADVKALASLCQTLLSSNEFLYVD